MKPIPASRIRVDGEARVQPPNVGAVGYSRKTCATQRERERERERFAAMRAAKRKLGLTWSEYTNRYGKSTKTALAIVLEPGEE